MSPHPEEPWGSGRRPSGLGTVPGTSQPPRRAGDGTSTCGGAGPAGPAQACPPGPRPFPGPRCLAHRQHPPKRPQTPSALLSGPHVDSSALTSPKP